MTCDVHVTVTSNVIEPATMSGTGTVTANVTDNDNVGVTGFVSGDVIVWHCKCC